MRLIFATYFIAISLLLFPGVVFAQTLADDTTSFFTKPGNSAEAIDLSSSQIEHDVIAFRNALDQTLHYGEIDLLDSALRSPSNTLQENHPKLLELGSIFSKSFEDQALNRDKLIARLNNFESGGDWYVAVYANTALSVLHIRRRELLLASRYTQSALDVIPDEVSALVKDAQLLLARQVNSLYGISADPRRMLEANQTLSRLHNELGLEFNRYESMTNFLLAFNRKRDHDSAQAIAELISVEPRPDVVAEGLSEVYIADLYNEIGDHREALSYALKASTASDPLIQRRSTGEAMIAYAGLGRRADAIREMRALGLWENGAPTDRADQSEGALHARALMASSRGDASEAVALMNRRLDLMIGKMYDRSANDTASLLSHLENNRERQQERENALEREAELKAVQLEQQNRLNRLLWILIIGLAVAFNFLLAFLRYREKNNRKVQTLQDDALSAEKMKTEFLGVINHELRTPLNGIIGMSDAMIHHAKDPAMKQQALTVQESGQLLHDLLDSLITMSTIEGNRLSLDAEPVMLSRLLSREADEWADPAARKGLDYTQHIGPELEGAVLADGPHIRKCTKFLLSNAVRFTHSGRIHLHATGETVDETHMALTLIVADTGQGISETVQERLFKPFLQADNTMTRKYGGAGLSLAIARKLARMMGGDLIVNSREGRGSEFIFTARLPLAEEAAMPSRNPTPRSEVSANSDEDVLILDQPLIDADISQDSDSPEVLIDLMLEHPMFAPHREKTVSPERLHILLLDKEGETSCGSACEDFYDCTTLEDPDRLIRRLKRGNIEAVIINLGFGEFDPIGTVRRIRELPGPVGRTPLVGLTQPETASLGSDLIMAGMDAFLSAPLTPQALRETVARIHSEQDAA